ncbi:GIY-YIG nuclease family protein [Rhodococcus sp. SORGH_AS_0303]|uniref:GIY-YIG nuclease family protein n=1 Tax=Rhodococcus sp. SORGH_AS_0303 TaxID=3041753 RepID=UPI00277D2CEE|nr:GIY-YIG nuclease family protein [Rhodococcus sp. SORGH_AS_0303]MDQ1200492.1 hypothetical protein [Rhodococcus sp. SORGH_AS_0303]
MTEGSLVPEVSEVLSPRDELSVFIQGQQGRIGDVSRLSAEGLDATQIANALNVASTGFVYSYRAYIDAAVNGTFSAGPTMLRQTQATLNSLIARGQSELSVEALNLLIAHRAQIGQALFEVDPVEAARDDDATGRQEAIRTESFKGLSGIYAFSYGWYLEKPVAGDGLNTLIKVGRSVDVAARIADHRRNARAHIPEPLVVLRVYGCDLSLLSGVEKIFHRLLATAGHANPRRELYETRRPNEVGQEWFLTNADFLDEVASALKLRPIF